MKKLFLLSLFVYTANALGNDGLPSFSGPNFSGVYSCKGSNNKVGEYEVLARLKLNRASSHGDFGAYDFSTETENSMVYRGQAISNGLKLALTFNLSETKVPDYSTGIADVKRISNTRWAYTNNYYEPDEAGGDYGHEYCLMQKPVIAKKAKKKTIRNAGSVEMSNLS